MKTRTGHTPVAYFHIVSKGGADMGWVGYCEAINEAMLPAILHPGGAEGAEKRGLTDPPPVLGSYCGDAFVPYTWLRSVLTEKRDLFVVDAMKVAAENGMSATKAETANSNAKESKNHV